MSSRTKGKEGERELAKILRSYGYEARRGQQYCGIEGNADVVGIEGLHIECKRVEQISDEKALKQAERDARKGEVPTVMYRRNYEEWKTCIRLDLFMAIWSELTDRQKQNIREKVKILRK